MTRRSLLLAAMPVFAAESAGERGKRAIAETLQALGGENFLRMRDRVETGRAYAFYREELTGLSRSKLYTRYLDNPEPGKLGVEERQSFGKKEESATLFLDGHGFDVTFRGARPIADSVIEKYFESTRHNFFYILRMRYREPGLIFERTGGDVIENQPVDKVDIIDERNEVITVYLHASTKLPVRQRFYRRDLKTGERIEEITRYSKYHAGGKGVMWPLDLQRERDTEKLTEIYDETVKIDSGLADSLFRLPSEMKVLPKEKA